jgi:hypothetical protein
MVEDILFRGAWAWCLYTQGKASLMLVQILQLGRQT